MSLIKTKDSKGEIVLEDVLLDADARQGRIDGFFDNKKIYRLRWVIFGVTLLLLGQLFSLQVLNGNYYRTISEKNYARTVATKAARGVIYDRNMTQIVFNVPSFDLTLVPSDFFKDRKNLEANKQALAAALEISLADLEERIKNAVKNPNGFESVLILENIPKEKALLLEDKIKSLGGIKLENNALRQYIDGVQLSSLVGYSGRVSQKDLLSHPDYLPTDSIGKDGLEASYEKDLRGVYGRTEVAVDSRGKVDRSVESQAPAAGHNLVLNVDAQLQKRLYGEIEKMTQKFPESTGGSAVALDPRTGAVLALVSYPSYDNNAFAGGISSADYQALLDAPNRPLFNRPLAGEYPPGSTFKPMVAAAAMQEKIIDPTRRIFDSGAIRVGGWTFVDWRAHGSVDLVKAIAQSCNVYFYTVGGGYGDIQGLGAERLKKYANLFGLGELTGIDLPGERSGLIPDAAWKQKNRNERWYIGDTYHMAIGQGDVLSTPLQIANYTAAIANGGTLYRPQVVNRLLNSEGVVVQQIQPEAIRQGIVDADAIAWVQKGMRANVLSGSGMSISSLEVQSAGKTGTAQYAGNKKSHAWYTVYAPYQNPEIVLTVMVEGGGEGHAAAVPVAKEILRWYFGERLKQPVPTENQAVNNPVENSDTSFQP